MISLQGRTAAAQTTWQRRLRLARPRMHQRLHQRLQDGLRPLLGDAALPRRLSGGGYIADFLARLDAAALRAEAPGWIEKTPDHLAYVDVIRARCPDAMFVHVLRRGEDVVASAVDAEIHYADHQVFQGGVTHWVQRWNRAAEVHRRCAGQPGHWVLCHEDLLQQPDVELARLLRFLALPPADVSLPRQALADPAREPWKQQALSGRVAPVQAKAAQLFGPALQQFLRRGLHDYTAVRQQVLQAQARAEMQAQPSAARPPRQLPVLARP